MMVKLRNLTQRYPIVFAAGMTLAYVGISKLVSFLVAFVPKGYAADAIFEVAHMFWPVAVAILLGYGFALKEKGFGKTFKAALGVFCAYLLFAVLVVVNALNKPGVAWQGWDRILLGVVMLLGVGLREDLLYRGVVQNALAIKHAKSARGIWLTVAVSSAAFGLLHFFNMLSGVTFGAACVQVLGAAAMGAVFGAIYLRGGNIWVPILLHALVDFLSLFKSTFTTNAGTEIDKINSLDISGLYAMVPLLILLTVFLLRKSKHAEILERMEALRAKYGAEA